MLYELYLIYKSVMCELRPISIFKEARLWTGSQVFVGEYYILLDTLNHDNKLPRFCLKLFSNFEIYSCSLENRRINRKGNFEYSSAKEAYFLTCTYPNGALQVIMYNLIQYFNDTNFRLSFKK